MTESKDRSPLWHPAVLLLAWLLLTIGMRPLLLPDEGRYAGVAREMLLGDGITPTLNGLPFFHKPPLLYWLDMASLSLLGTTEFAMRVGPALLGWALGLALLLHLRRWHGERVARLGLVVLATSMLFFVGAQYVNHDIGVAACITVAVLALVRSVDEGPGVSLRWLLAGWAACAMGVLAKGLIGVVLPLLVVVPWLLGQRRWRQALGLLHPLALLAFGLLALPWMVAMQSQHPEFVDYFIVEQHFRRYAGAAFNNREPFWFFPLVLPGLMLPWTIWIWPALRQGGKHAGLYLWWIVVIVGFFSIPSSKLVGYVLPALAPAAALLALALQDRERLTRKLGVLAALLCLAVVALLAWKAPGSHRDVGQALAERWRTGDRVVFVDQFFYDIPVYARLPGPVAVVSDWDDPELPRHDNWRKELHDAARFAPDKGASVLWPWSRLEKLPCGARWWLVTTHEELPRVFEATRARMVFEGRHAQLLQVDARACAAAPAG